MTSPEEEIVQLRRLRMVASTNLERARRELRVAEVNADRYRGDDRRQIQRLETLVTLMEAKVLQGDSDIARIDREIRACQKQIDKKKR